MAENVEEGLRFKPGPHLRRKHKHKYIKTLRSSYAYAYVYVAIVSSEDMMA